MTRCELHWMRQPCPMCRPLVVDWSRVPAAAPCNDYPAHTDCRGPGFGPSRLILGHSQDPRRPWQTPQVIQDELDIDAARDPVEVFFRSLATLESV